MSRVISFLTLNVDTASGLTANIYAGEDGTIACKMSPVVNITGWALKFTVRKTLNVLPILITKVIGAGQIVITNGPNGEFEITLASVDTASATPGDYFFDIQRTDAGFKSELGIGVLTLLQPVAAL